MDLFGTYFWRCSMYYLIGIRYDYTPNSYTGKSEESETRDIIASFDTEDLASEYIRYSKLKSPKREIWSSDMPFKKKSLLGSYSYAEIEEYIPEDYPHNPVPPYTISRG